MPSVCGLVGSINLAAVGGTERAQQLREALPLMHHRGPDDTQVWNNDHVVFGFARLAIIDIDGSPQPLAYDDQPGDSRYRIIFNGEIYNYLELRTELSEKFGATFQTQGDTEAIVAAYKYYGDECVSRLRGMFSFAIWDDRDQRLFGARDHFGIKPMYVATDGETTYFGSEKKCLLALLGDERAQTVDPTALQHYLTLQYVPEPASMTPAVRRIESGSSFVVDRDGLRTTRWFNPDFPIRSVNGPLQQKELYHRIAEVLDDSVRMHMRADVTVGAFLSGGIDSTAIAALAKRYNPDLLTFTVGFEREGFSEIDVAAQSAEAIGVQHITKVVTPEEFADAVPLIVWYLDDPVADPALVPLWFIAREARKHVKVVLSGEGADELFGGYNIYREPLSLRAFNGVPAPLRRGIGRLSTALPDGLRGKDLLRRGALPIEQRYYGNARIFRDDELTFLKTRRLEVSYMDVTHDIYERCAAYDDVTKMQYVDLFTWLRGDILVKADKMTMANSLELRVPFLDKEVFALASTLPVSERVTKQTTKYALRQGLREIVPPHILDRRKLGFPVPTRHWLRDELYDWARTIIAESGAGHLIDLPAIQQMLDAHRAGPLDRSRKIWTVLIFLLWYGIFVERRIVPVVPEVHFPVRL